MKKNTANLRSLVLAHRGASATAPENTIASFLRARYLGADGIELDVRLSRDDVPVVIHDATVDRTTDGHGAVRDLTIVELKALDAGSWKGSYFAGERIPTLAEVFDALGDWLKPTGRSGGRAATINIEFKGLSLRSDGIEREVVNLVVKRGLERRVIISSFNALVLARVRSLNPGLYRGLLYSSELRFVKPQYWLRYIAWPQMLHPEHTLIDAGHMHWANRRGYRVNAWTVNEPDEAVRLQGLGVSGIITNQPDVIQQALESAAESATLR
ncbi:MAG: glycerophosphodiester phosphodiesterase [Rudaea sp.]